MKKLSIFIFILLLFGACKKRAIFFKDATILSPDSRKCGCCGGFFMVIEEEADTFLIDIDSSTISSMQWITASDSIQDIPNHVVLPFDVKVKYKIDNDCSSENRITEYHINTRD